MAERDRLIAALAEKEVFSGIHYPIPGHLLEAYRSLGLGKGSFPVAEKTASGFVSLPMYLELSNDQIGVVVGEILDIIRTKALS